MLVNYGSLEYISSVWNLFGTHDLGLSDLRNAWCLDLQHIGTSFGFCYNICWSRFKNHKHDDCWFCTLLIVFTKMTCHPTRVYDHTWNIWWHAVLLLLHLFLSKAVLSHVKHSNSVWCGRKERINDFVLTGEDLILPC